MNKVSLLYDNLFSFESSKNEDSYPIHKRLEDHSKTFNSFDWICANVSFNPGESILDLGCGTGYTLISLAKSIGIKGVGISISAKEVHHAQTVAKRYNLDKKVTFLEGDFENTVNGEYDKIIAIESLKHCQNLKATLGLISKNIRPGGTFIIAEDFILADHPFIEKQKSYWEADGFTSLNQFVLTLNDQNEYDIETKDLSPYVKTRPRIILKFLIWLISSLVSVFRNNSLLTTYQGGLLLEYLIHTKKVSYNILIAKKH